MAAYTLELEQISGLGTITCKLSLAGTDNVAATIEFTERENMKGFYVGTFTGTLAGVYNASLAVGASQIGSDQFELRDADGTYQSNSIRSGQAASIWAHTTRTLTSFGSLVSDIVAAIQSYLFGDGSFAIGIRVSNGTNFLQNALVRVSKDGLSHTDYTDANGWVNFSLNSGDWSISITADGHGFTPTTFTVTASANLPTFIMTPVSITPPSDPYLCSVLFTVHRNNEPIADARINITLANNSTTNGIIQWMSLSVLTDEDGEATVEMIRKSQFTAGGIYSIEIVDPSGETLYKQKVRVPDSETCTAEDLFIV